MEIKTRELIEAELTLVRHQLATQRSSWIQPEVMRGAEEALNWVLTGRPSPAPLSAQWRDPTNALELRTESDFAEEVWFANSTARELSPVATSGNVRLFAQGVSVTLGWVCGAREDDAMGQDDEMIMEEIEEVGAKTPHTRPRPRHG